MSLPPCTSLSFTSLLAAFWFDWESWSGEGLCQEYWTRCKWWRTTCSSVLCLEEWWINKPAGKFSWLVKVANQSMLIFFHMVKAVSAFGSFIRMLKWYLLLNKSWEILWSWPNTGNKISCKIFEYLTKNLQGCFYRTLDALPFIAFVKNIYVVKLCGLFWGLNKVGNKLFLKHSLIKYRIHYPFRNCHNFITLLYDNFILSIEMRDRKNIKNC